MSRLRVIFYAMVDVKICTNKQLYTCNYLPNCGKQGFKGRVQWQSRSYVSDCRHKVHQLSDLTPDMASKNDARNGIGLLLNTE